MSIQDLEPNTTLGAQPNQETEIPTQPPLGSESEFTILTDLPDISNQARKRIEWHPENHPME